MPPLTLRRKLSLAAVLLAFVGVFALAWQLRRQHQQRAVTACRTLRAEIKALKNDEFDQRLEEMRMMRLNPSQAQTLRNSDPDAYARFAVTYGQLVEQVAEAADRLGQTVDDFQSRGCVDLGGGP